MKKAAQVIVGTGILLLAGWWWRGQYPGMALARDKKQEAGSVKVRLLAEDEGQRADAGGRKAIVRGQPSFAPNLKLGRCFGGFVTKCFH